MSIPIPVILELLGLLFLEGPLDDLGQTCSIVGRNL